MVDTARGAGRSPVVDHSLGRAFSKGASASSRWAGPPADLFKFVSKRMTNEKPDDPRPTDNPAAQALGLQDPPHRPLAQEHRRPRCTAFGKKPVMADGPQQLGPQGARRVLTHAGRAQHHDDLPRARDNAQRKEIIDALEA
jgi:hypothetical protein